MFQYIFAIYTCKKNIHKANITYEIVHKKFENNGIKTLIVYGDNKNNRNELIEDKYLLLNCGDNYENLHEKSKELFTVINECFSDIQGVFKCDDDILINVNYLLKSVDFIKKNNVDYCGIETSTNNNNNVVQHYNKCSSSVFNIPMYMPTAKYCAGPLYYLSQKSLKIFSNNISSFFYEDIQIGWNLNQYDIYPTNYFLYNELDIYDKNSQHLFIANIHNDDKSIKTLYVRIHGGLGNQLFQIASAYGIARKHCMCLVILYNNDLTIYSHNKSLFEFLDTIFKDLNYVCIDNIKLIANDVNIYSEINTNQNLCYLYNHQIINENKDYFLDGYFQNELYFKDYKNEVIMMFTNMNDINKLNNKYPNLKNSYFIHIRRGDYVDNKLYEIDYDKYFTMAIEKIISNDKTAHFYIVSNDISYCKTLEYLTNTNKTFVNNMSTLNTLYLMSLCKKGGICSNSSFSWWGGYLNTNPNKIVVFPNKWINTNYIVDIQYEGSTIIDL